MRLSHSKRHARTSRAARRAMSLQRVLAAFTTQRGALGSGRSRSFREHSSNEAFESLTQLRRAQARSTRVDSPETSSSVETTGAAFLSADR
jgi:hypothetical protein